MATTSAFYDYPSIDLLAQWAVEGREPRMVTYTWPWQAISRQDGPLIIKECHLKLHTLDPKSKQR